MSKTTLAAFLARQPGTLWCTVVLPWEWEGVEFILEVERAEFLAWPYADEPRMLCLFATAPPRRGERYLVRANGPAAAAKLEDSMDDGAPVKLSAAWARQLAGPTIPG